MISFYKVSTPKEEIDYLQRVNEYNTRLRDKYTTAFFVNHNLQKKYEKIFTPITKPLNRSLQRQQVDTPSSPPSDFTVHHPPVDTSTPYDRKKKRKPSVDSLLGVSQLDTQNFQPQLSAEDDDIGVNISSFFKSSKNDFGIRDEFFGVRKTQRQGLYKFLGKSIRFTGPQAKRTGFRVTEPKEFKQDISIHSRALWDIILLKYPSSPPLQKDLLAYGKILNALGFTNWWKNQRQTQMTRQMVHSEKYTVFIQPALESLANEQGGGGIMYTRKSPQSYTKKKSGHGIHTTVEFFPSNKKALLKKLSYLLGEYRSGNTKSLRNEIVPIVQYLKSINSLPKKQVKTLNWLYD